MPALNIYIDDALYESLARFSSAEINRSKVCADALRRAVVRAQLKLKPKTRIQTK